MPMQFRFSATVSTLLLVSTAVARAQTQYFVCSARNKENTLGYVSGVVSASPANPGDVDSAWKAMANSKYVAFPSSTSCMQFPTAKAAEAKRANIVYTMIDDGLKITNSDWTYTASASPPAGPAAASQGPQAELPQSKGYCEQNYKGVFDCDCFAQA